ncbi:MAG: aminodeoxychorismate lyase, partial [Bacteroidetes bacterium]|nr:aminodeoxychorismate lyase [Bacteroidota bacterium]
MAKEQKSSGRFRLVIVLVIVIIIALGSAGVFYYTKYFSPNVTDKQEYLYIHTGADYKDVLKTVTDEGIVKDPASFDWAARHMNYIKRVKAG